MFDTNGTRRPLPPNTGSVIEILRDDDRSTIVVAGPRRRRQVVKVIGPVDHELGWQWIAAAEELVALGVHDGIVPVREALWVGERHVALVMDHHGRGDLANRLAQRGTIPAPQVAAIGAIIAGALDHALSVDRPRLHGDVAPANIVLDADGVPALIDWWLPPVQSAASPTEPPLAGGVATDPGLGYDLRYGAPGRRAEPSPADDVFGLCATLHHLLTGSPPFGTTFADRVDLDVATEVPRIDGAPADLADAIASGLLRDPSQRPDARQLRKRLYLVRSIDMSIVTPRDPPIDARPLPITRPSRVSRPAAGRGGEPPRAPNDGGGPPTEPPDDPPSPPPGDPRRGRLRRGDAVFEPGADTGPIILGPYPTHGDEDRLWRLALIAHEITRAGEWRLRGRVHLELAHAHRARSSITATQANLELAATAFGVAEDFDGLREVEARRVEWDLPDPDGRLPDAFPGSLHINTWQAILDAERAVPGQLRAAVDRAAAAVAETADPLPHMTPRLALLHLEVVEAVLRSPAGSTVDESVVREAATAYEKARQIVRDLVSCPPSLAAILDLADVAIELARLIAGHGAKEGETIDRAVSALTSLDEPAPEGLGQAGPGRRLDVRAARLQPRLVAQVERRLGLMLELHDELPLPVELHERYRGSRRRKRARPAAADGRPLADDPLDELLIARSTQPSTTRSDALREALGQRVTFPRPVPAPEERVPPPDVGAVPDNPTIVWACAVLTCFDHHVDHRMWHPSHPLPSGLGAALEGAHVTFLRQQWPTLAAGARRRQALFAMVEPVPDDPSAALRRARDLRNGAQNLLTDPSVATSADARAEAAALEVEEILADPVRQIDVDAVAATLPELEHRPRVRHRACVHMAQRCEAIHDDRGAAWWWQQAADAAPDDQLVAEALTRSVLLRWTVAPTDANALADAERIRQIYRVALHPRSSQWDLRVALGHADRGDHLTAMKVFRDEGGGQADQRLRASVALKLELDNEVGGSWPEDTSELSDWTMSEVLLRARIVADRNRGNNPAAAEARQRTAELLATAMQAITSERAAGRPADLLESLALDGANVLMTHLVGGDAWPPHLSEDSLDEAYKVVNVARRLPHLRGDLATIDSHLETARATFEAHGLGRDVAECHRLSFVAALNAPSATDAERHERGMRALESDRRYWENHPDHGGRRFEWQMFEEIRSFLLRGVAGDSGAAATACALVEMARQQAVPHAQNDAGAVPPLTDAAAIVAAIVAQATGLAAGSPWVWWGMWSDEETVHHTLIESGSGPRHMPLFRPSNDLKELSQSLPHAVARRHAPLAEPTEEADLMARLGRGLIPERLREILSTGPSEQIVFIAPDPVLRQVPFALLSLDADGSSPLGHTRLVERCTPWLVPPLGHLVWCEAQQDPPPDPARLADFAIVDPGGTELLGAQRWTTDEPAEIRRRRSASPEPASVSSADELLRLVWQRPRRGVVLAHARINADHPSRSAVVAGEELGDVLTGQGILQLGRRGGPDGLHLAVCDGLGPVTRGEWLGVGPSLLLTGTGTVITSTWPVLDHLLPLSAGADDEAPEVLSHHVDHLVWQALGSDDRHPADALAEVMRTLLTSWRGDGSDEDALPPISPSYWGSLVALSARPRPKGSRP